MLRICLADGTGGKRCDRLAGIPRLDSGNRRQGLRFPRLFVCQRWGSCYQFFLVLVSDPVLQEMNWGRVAESGMLPLPIVEDLDVLEASGLHFGVAGLSNSMHALVLEAVEPAFCRCVIPSIAFPAHRAGHAIFLELVLKGMAGVLVSPIGVVHQA